MQKGKITEDTSYVYSLPYARGTSHLLIQGYFSSFSHKNRAALDFKMKPGTEVYAARDGIVIRLEEQHDKGGRNKKYRKDANLVVIQHDDGSKAGYWHLQKNGVLVNMGDTVHRGQLIALSGKTGYTFLPHLHFIVWTNKNGGWQQVPTRFQISKGIKYLRPFRKYRNP
ncbi:MAG: M23 family metallopeptidase [Panacibacter sp.]